MKPFFKALLLTTLVAGTADLLSAYVDQFIQTGKFADRMLLYMAGGALGLETSMRGGFWVGALGLFFHYFISFAFTLLMFLLYPKLNFQRLNKYAVRVGIGLLYSPIAGLIMGQIVLPLTKLPPGRPFVFSLGMLKGWGIFAVVFTIPIVIGADLYYRRRLQKPFNDRSTAVPSPGTPSS